MWTARAGGLDAVAKRRSQARRFGNEGKVRGAERAVSARERRAWSEGPGRPPLGGLDLGLIEVERQGVDAVALAGWRGAVVEDVPEVAATAPAHDLGSDHAV